MFYKEVEDCWQEEYCDNYWNIYLKVAKNLKGIIKAHVMNCDDWSMYAEEYHPYFSVDFCEPEEELYDYLPHSMIY